MKAVRYEDYTMPMRRTVETYSCNNCGVTVDADKPATIPDGWHQLSRREADTWRSFHFDEYECMFGFVMAHEDGLPTKLQEDLENSIAILTAEKEMAK
jgi:hypothetical protein